MALRKNWVPNEHGQPHVYMVGNHYGHSLATILDMATEARKDFPMLNDSDINFRTYRNTGYIDGMLGLEFKVPKGAQIPEDYTEASRLPSY
jgi:hypothetical protein